MIAQPFDVSAYLLALLLPWALGYVAVRALLPRAPGTAVPAVGYGFVLGLFVASKICCE